MAERPHAIGRRAEPSEATPAGGGGRVVVVRSAPARGRADGGSSGKPSDSQAGAKSGSSKGKGGGEKPQRTGGSVRSVSATTAGKTGKGGAKKTAKKGGAKGTRKGPAKKGGSRPAGKKAAPKKTRKAAAKARKAPARKTDKRPHKTAKTPRKSGAKKSARRPGKAGRKGPAKKPAKRAPAKKTTKSAARKAAKHAPARPPARAARKTPPAKAAGRPGEAAPDRAHRKTPPEAAPDAAAKGISGTLAATPRPAQPGRRRKAASAGVLGQEGLGEAVGVEPGTPPAPGARPPRGEPGARKRRKAARFDTEQPEVRKKKRARLEKMRRAGIFGVPGARPRRLRKRKLRDEVVRPSPPLEKTDPLKHYLAGEMVPCPVGCGGFSEVVRVSTMENGAGEIWFECLSCAQRKMFEIPRATAEEQKAIFAELEAGHEPLCPRHTKPVSLRRRGFDFVCPECGVRFAEP